MAVMPGATFLDVTYKRTPMAAYNRVNLHIAVSEAASLFGFFNRANQVCSHFYVRRDGTFDQYVDTKYRAAADYQGNDATISIETQGMADGTWTDEQVATLARIYAWARETHGIADRIVTDSRVGDSSKGLSYHRFGIDPWRVSGGMYYSTSRGKVCPTDQRIAQVQRVFDLSHGTETPAIPVATPAAPAPAPAAPGRKKIDVDGSWGGDTTQYLQETFGTTADRVISHQYKSAANEHISAMQFDKTLIGSNLILAMQDWLIRKGRYSGKRDGLAGRQFITGLQAEMGTPQDGVISPDSACVREMQRRLNAGTLL